MSCCLASSLSPSRSSSTAPNPAPSSRAPTLRPPEPRAQPAQLVTKALSAGRILEQRTCGAQERAEPPRRHALFMQLLGIGTQPHSRLTGEKLLPISPQRALELVLLARLEPGERVES